MNIKTSFHIVIAVITAFQIVLFGVISEAQAGPTLDATQARGSLLCSTAGHLHTVPSDYEKPGNMEGFDRDFCRAIAAATLGDASAVKFSQLVPTNRFLSLQKGEKGDGVDVLVRTTTWNLTRDASMHVHFAAINFYDGQGFLARKSLGVTRLSDLRKMNKEATVCVEASTTSLDNVKNYIIDQGLPVKLIEFTAYEELRFAFNSGRCDLYTSDQSHLIKVRLEDTSDPKNYVILEDVVSKEPLGVAVRDDDAQWFNIVRWAVYATIQAEELGITSANADDLRENGTTAQKRFLGEDTGFGKLLGLDDKWAYRIVKSVGNYGEIFERNLGEATIYNVKRGVNNLWTRGGLMYSPPF